MGGKSFTTVMQQVQYIVLRLITAYFWFTVVTFLEEKPPLLPSLASQENDPLFLSVLWFTLSTKKYRCPNVISNIFLLIWLDTENSFLVEWHVVSSGSVLKTTESIWNRGSPRAFSPSPEVSLRQQSRGCCSVLLPWCLWLVHCTQGFWISTSLSLRKNE